MTKEINGHKIEHTSNLNPYGSVHKYRCVNDNCWIESKGEYGAFDYIKELAEKYSCPSGTGNCIKCGCDIAPDRDICKTCHTQLTRGEKIL